MASRDIEQYLSGVISTSYHFHVPASARAARARHEQAGGAIV